MPVTVGSYAGKLGFLSRKYLPKLSLFGFSLLHSLGSKGEIDFIKRCLTTEERYFPTIVHIETINRCNETCSFCPANKNDEKRPFKKMDYELFEKIINDLSEIDYHGMLGLYLNNEPFLDTRMVEMIKVARCKLPNAYVYLYTNGTLLTKEKLNSIAGYLDHLRVNNYNNKFELTESSKIIYEYVKNNESLFSKTLVRIDMRFNGEYLSNRAGNAPNRSDNKTISGTCLMPFTDFNIFPDGTVGLCSSDVLAKTNYGNVGEQSILDIFHNEKFKELRKMIYPSRGNVEFCKGCDFVDRGGRIRYHDYLRNKN